MARTREYFLTQEFSPEQLSRLILAQNALYWAANGQMSQSQLATTLGNTSDILSVYSVVGGSASGIASIFFGVLGDLLSTEKNTLISMMNKGYYSLTNISEYGRLQNATSYEITMPILEYTDDNIRVVSGTCSGRLYVNGVWIS